MANVVGFAMNFNVSTIVPAKSSGDLPVFLSWGIKIPRVCRKAVAGPEASDAAVSHRWDNHRVRNMYTICTYSVCN